ncbi:MAG: InlB B-repeat-containing protein [Lachnospiraceae bacterium]|nr:InlB B-repeat-containing protein [Lachnospiraceae bacterium]
MNGQDVPYLGHIDSWTTVTKPTETSVGSEKSTCTRCKAVVKTRELYLISYKANGGSGAPSSQTKSQGVAITLANAVPTRTNYTFLGWATSANSTKVAYASGASYTENKNLTLYAVWQYDYCTITFVANNCTGTVPDSIKAKRGSYITIPKASLSKTHYYFMGWALTENASKYDYKSNDSMHVTTDRKLYAVWQPRNYLLEFNLNGGTGTAPKDRSIPYGSSTTIGSASLTREGFFFLGWSTSSTATSAMYNSSSSITITDKTTLYAVWSEIKYQIDFNGNSNGRGTVSNIPGGLYKYYTKDLTLPTKTPTLKGYKFIGWAASATGAVQWTAGGKFNINAKTTLYAVWQKDTECTLVFDANGGKSAPSSITVPKGTSVKIPGFAMSRDGFWFAGWATSKNATEKEYTSASDPITLSKDMTLYAVWTEKKYQIGFSGNSNGKGTVSKVPGGLYKYHTKTLILPTQVPSLSGYTFLGWADNATATTAKWPAGGKFDVNADTTLYAVWEDSNNYTLTFNANGGKPTPSPILVPKGSSVKIPYFSISREGYWFSGWATTRSATEKEYTSASAPITLTKNTTLYAVWTEKKYQIGFSGNSNGRGTVKNVPGGQYKYYTKDLILPTQKPSLSGYTFLGWADNAAATKAKWAAGAKFSVNADTTLYAVWAKDYTINYFCNGGSADGKGQFTEYCTGDTQKITSIKPKATGYTFVGWSVEGSKKNIVYTEKDTLKTVLKEVGSEVDTIYLQAIWRMASVGTHVLGNDCEICFYGMNAVIYIPRSQISTFMAQVNAHNSTPTDKYGDPKAEDRTSDGAILEQIRNALYYASSGYRIDYICKALDGKTFNYKTDYVEIVLLNDRDGLSINEIVGNVAEIPVTDGIWYALKSFECKLSQLISSSNGAKLIGFNSFVATIGKDGSTIHYGIRQGEFLNDSNFMADLRKRCEKVASDQVNAQYAIMLSADPYNILSSKELADWKTRTTDELIGNLSNGICGPTSAIAVYLYLSGQKKNITFNQIYNLLLDYFDTEDGWLDWASRSIVGGDAWWSVTHFLENKLKVSASAGALGLGRVWFDDMRGEGYKKINKMLNNDIPVLMAFYSPDEELRFLYSNGSLDMAADAHYFVATGFLESADGLHKYLKVSTTWGPAGYINWYEYLAKANRGVTSDVGSGYVDIH